MSKTAFLTGAAVAALLTLPANAEGIDVPAGGLKDALSAYTAQTGVHVLYAESLIKGAQTKGFRGNLPADQALSRILAGTGLMPHQDAGVVEIIRGNQSSEATQVEDTGFLLAQAAPRASVETVTVTSSKLGGADVQSVPIAITALSQEQLTATQTAGGPDLVKQVPNLTFTKTNFTGYSIQIRGIGTQAISVATDPAVAVAMNDTPFIRNHFFEQEFYDVAAVEVLRGPQGTLYGRNATAGVVNVTTAKPTDHYEAMGSVDVGNYNNRRLEGMLNIPILGDKLGIRMAGEWTKRDGYTYNTTLEDHVDGRNLWSGRVTVGFQPIEKLRADITWEHFHENDDRLRSAKALCNVDNGPTQLAGPSGLITNIDISGAAYMSQGCKPGSLYGDESYQAPNAGSLPFVVAAEYVFFSMPQGFDPYGGIKQSKDLRIVDSAGTSNYRANNDTIQGTLRYQIDPTLTLVSQTAYSKDMLYSTQDYNRFNTVAGAFAPLNISPETFSIDGSQTVGADGQFCDPQLGCSDRLIGQDVSQQHSEQFSQEIRLASSFDGPLNFTVGGNYMRYSTLEDYYLFFNLISMLQENQNIAKWTSVEQAHVPFDPVAANTCYIGGSPRPVADILADPNGFWNSLFGSGCGYVDPNPLHEIDGDGHNYFRSQNPYKMHSWAAFGEANYQIAPDVKLTGGLRWTDDVKSFTKIPSWTYIIGKGYAATEVVDQQWKKITGRAVATWTPKLDFADQSLFYASFAHGYKGGGANPPGVIQFSFFGFNTDSPSNRTHPETFKPEFVNAYELGTKQTLLDGSLTMNGDVFYYDYKDYQISQLVDRTAVNLNFDATVKGAEMEATWEPIPGLRFNAAVGYQDARLAKGSKAIDLMDRTAGDPNWVVMKPFITQTSNCIMPTAVLNQIVSKWRENQGGSNSQSASQNPDQLYYKGDGIALTQVCWQAYTLRNDPGSLVGVVTNFNPDAAPNYGAGIEKDISNNVLPNTPPVTMSFGAQYSTPISEDWAGTLRGDFYWQADSFARVFNSRPYDELHGYSNVNLAMIFTNQDGWQAMAYVKNLVDTTAITGAFLNTDDTGLTTNVFVTDPRLFGIRITKNW